MEKTDDDAPESKRNKIDKLWQTLEHERDELRLQMHLARSEVRDEWEELEEKWKHLNDQALAVKNKLKSAGDTASESGEKISDTWHILMDDIKTGYSRIRHKLG